jgi:acetylornithine/N-succinyldiaminopimelate aminotransferase
MKPENHNDLFVPAFSRTGSPMIRGEGMYLVDADGRRYLDFGSGIAVSALGHGHPRLLSVLREQGEKLLHLSNLYFSQPQIDLARMLVRHSFGSKVFLCNSGTEAIEAAIKFSRKWASKSSIDKYHILSFYKGFHGRTYGALSATAQQQFHDGFGPLLPGFHYADLNDIDGAKSVLDKYNFSAVIVEPIQGEGGVNIASRDFLAFLRDYATAHGAALVFDEIQCGMGRTGKLWCYEHYGIVPDILAAAKPLGGGLPLGAVICTEHVASAISPGNHGSTFGGNPLACALGCALMSIVSEPAFLKKVTHSGELIQERLWSLASKFPFITDVRGKGLLIGAQFAFDPKPIIPLCKEKGLLLIKAEHNTVRFMPPLIVEEADIDAAMAIFEEVLKIIEKDHGK